MRNTSFSPQWLQRRLATLLPDYPDVSLCVALSGGLDSSALLAALATHGRKRVRKRTRLRAIHVHHGLHPNADKWSEHCVELARQFNIPLETLRVKVARPRGASLEAAARAARYTALADSLEPGEILLTAHHEDDQLETVFLQLMRGAGVAGLAAMPEVAPFAGTTLVRPLLTRSREDLESWAKANAITWVDDDTNENEQLDRNYLRRRVLPLIRERWPGAARAVSRSARHAAEAKRLLDALALADVERASNGPALSVQYLRALAPDRRRNVVRFWIARAGHPLPDATRLDEITRTLLEARADANPSVDWNSTRVQRHADLLTLASAKSAPAADSEVTRWNWRNGSPQSPGGLGGSRGSRGSLSIISDPHGPLDLDKLPESLGIRQRKGGERLRPKIGGPSRTLKQLLQESRIPLAERAALPLIFAGDTLIAVADRWLDDSVQATPGTQHRGRLRWQRE